MEKRLIAVVLLALPHGDAGVEVGTFSAVSFLRYFRLSVVMKSKTLADVG